MSDTFEGQLEEHSEYGHLFRYSPGAKAGVIIENDIEIGSFTRVDMGGPDEPLGIYVRETGGTEYLYADTINGASAYLVGLRKELPRHPQDVYTIQHLAWVSVFEAARANENFHDFRALTNESQLRLRWTNEDGA